MPKKRHKPEEIVAKLRQVDVSVSQGKPVAEAVRSIAVTEVPGSRPASLHATQDPEDDEAALIADIVALALQYGRYGYRRITAMLRRSGWVVNRKRVARIWQREGLKVPQKQPKKGRLWLADGSCVRLRPERPNQVWSYDFVEDKTHDKRKVRMLNVIDEFSRECLAIRVSRRLNATDVVDVLWDLFILRGVPGHTLRQRA